MSIFNFFKNNNIEESVIQKQIKVFSKLKINNTFYAHSSICSITKVLSLEQNIIGYINLLKGAIHEININSISLGMYMNKELHEVTISKFFINNNKYVDVNIHLEEFNKLCIEFLTLYEEKNSILDKDFNTQKNIRLFSIIVNNISSLCTELINVIEENE